MVWTITKKEFLLNLMTFKFTVGTILCVVLMRNIRVKLRAESHVWLLRHKLTRQVLQRCIVKELTPGNNWE